VNGSSFGGCEGHGRARVPPHPPCGHLLPRRDRTASKLNHFRHLHRVLCDSLKLEFTPSAETRERPVKNRGWRPAADESDRKSLLSRSPEVCKSLISNELKAVRSPAGRRGNAMREGRTSAKVQDERHGRRRDDCSDCSGFDESNVMMSFVISVRVQRIRRIPAD
jgi:hypothetical protein